MGFHPKHFLHSQQQCRVAQGFTLIELLIAIAILAIIISMAAPSFTDFVVRSQVRTDNITFQGDIRFAQDQARSMNAPVKLATLTGSDEWVDGYSIWIDEDNDDRLGSTETLLRMRDSVDTDIAVRRLGQAAKLSQFSFEKDGTVLNFQSITINVCSMTQTATVTGRTLSILPSGTVQLTDDALNCSGGA